MGLISNATTIFDAGVINGAGAISFIKKLTASNSATLTFINGSSNVVLDGTYKEYLFSFKNIHPAGNAADFGFVSSVNGGTNFDAVNITSTCFVSYQVEGDNARGIEYSAGGDLAQGTGQQRLSDNQDTDADECSNGFLTLINPASTVFNKQFYTNISQNQDDPGLYHGFHSGYFNTGSAINAIQFAFHSGNIASGDICLYGVS